MSSKIRTHDKSTRREQSMMGILLAFLVVGVVLALSQTFWNVPPLF